MRVTRKPVMSMDVELVLHKMEEMGMIHLTRPIGDWYQCKCPIHSGGEEKKPSCGVLLHDQYRNGHMTKAGWVNCFSCHWSKPLPETITEILKRKNISKSGFDWLKENIPGFDTENAEFDYLIPQDLSQSLQNSYALKYLNSQIISDSKQYVSEQELASYRLTVPYMYQRGLTDEIIEKYDIGYDANFIPPGRKKPMPCITFPVKDADGNTLFLCRRSVQGKFFHYPQGVEKSVYGLYELPKNAKSVIVAESCFNALTAVKYGYNAVALLGTGTSYEIEQLRRLGVQEFVLCLDGDDAGQRGMAKLKKALKSVAIVWTIKMPANKDINDCSKEEFDALYATRE